MSLAAILALIQNLLPVFEEGIGFFIHKPFAQQKFAVTVGDINAVAGIASAVAPAIASAVEGKPVVPVEPPPAASA